MARTRPLSPVGQRVRTLGVLVLVLVVLLMGQPFLWRMVRGQARALQMAQSQTEQVAAVQSRVAALVEAHEAQRALLAPLAVSFPLSSGTLRVVERLEQQAVASGVAMEIVSVVDGEPLSAEGAAVRADEPADGSLAHLFPLLISIQATGASTDLLALLDRLEHLPELSVVDSLSLVPADQVGVELNAALSYTLTAELIFYLQGGSDG